MTSTSIVRVDCLHHHDRSRSPCPSLANLDRCGCRALCGVRGLRLARSVLTVARSNSDLCPIEGWHRRSPIIELSRYDKVAHDAASRSRLISCFGSGRLLPGRVRARLEAGPRPGGVDGKFARDLSGRRAISDEITRGSLWSGRPRRATNSERSHCSRWKAALRRCDRARLFEAGVLRRPIRAAVIGPAPAIGVAAVIGVSSSNSGVM